MDHASHQLDPIEPGQEDNPDMIRRNIQHTRAEIGETVNTLQARLSPERVKEEVKNAATEQMETAKENLRFKAEQWQRKATERIINNPIPAAMVGVGLMWLITKAAGSNGERDYGSRYRRPYAYDSHEDWPVYEPNEASGRVAHPRQRQGRGDSLQAKAQAFGQQTGEQFGQWADQAQESLSEWKSMARDQTGHLKDHARDQGEKAMGEFRRQLHDNPLAVGAMTLAIGTAIGLSLPRSHKEDEWLGETRDRLVDQAKSTVQDILPKVKQIGGEVQRAIQEQSGVA